MIPRILVCGAYGRMGRLAVEAIEQAADLELVGKVGSHDKLAAVMASVQPDIVVDLTVASAVYANVFTVIQAGVHPVIGTSGLTREQIIQLQAICQAKQLGGAIIPNFSLGAVLMMHYAQQAARYFSQVEIVEAHHPDKQDAPSGTAIRTAELIAQQSTLPNKPDYQESIPGARGAYYQGVPIHSIRLPGVVAKQAVILGAPGETLTIAHETIDRQSFMPGLLLVCRRVCELKELVVGLEHFLF